MMLAGWANHPKRECRTMAPAGTDAIASIVRSEPSLIARGRGRAYGDAALNPDATLLTRSLDRMIAFDQRTGQLTCEGGVVLEDIIDTLLPRGWFPPVVPGTCSVSLGGMIAADVHGKNHHRDGSFADHVEWIDLVVASGDVLRCSREENRDLFLATCGGMGLTGVIYAAAFWMRRVESGWMRQETVRCASLSETLERMERADDWTYSAAWIDTLATGAQAGRSVLFLGEHAKAHELEPEAPLHPPLRRKTALGVPRAAPRGALNRTAMTLFNAVYYRAQRSGTRLVPLEGFFFPLDRVRNWNHLYGSSGFVQFQGLLPFKAGATGLRALLDEVAATGSGSFLAVLKRMGRASGGLMSFPAPGFTLAVDLPMKPARDGRSPTLDVLDRLEAIVHERGGRVYLAKDAHVSARRLREGYPQLDRFQAVRERYGATDRFRSLQSCRTEL